MLNYILFDLDGTLTDPGIGITNSVMYALKKFGIEITDRTSLYNFIGPPLMYSFQTFHGFSEEDSTQAVKYYREYFSVHGLYENEVYFANEYERDPVEYKNDFAYPVNRWYARDGINCKRLTEVFGESFCDYT